MFCIAIKKVAGDRYQCLVCEPAHDNELARLIKYLRTHGANIVATYVNNPKPAPILNNSAVEQICKEARRVYM